MKSFAFFIALALLITTSVAFAQPAATQPAAAEAPAATTYPAGLESVAQRASYFFGVQIGNELKNAPISVDQDAFNRGLTDGLKANKLALTPQQIQETMAALQREMIEKQMAKAREIAERNKVLAPKNKAEGEAFLAKNKTAEGVVTTKSGLQYKILQEGKGKSPDAKSTVTVHYTGALLDGKVFDSSEGRGPATFSLDPTGGRGVIQGWSEGLQLMKEGGKYRLWIPPELAYKEDGAGEDIGPNAVLVFDVELLKIDPPQPELDLAH
ncbi:MAG: FKBP-type peptidyl-prolyl cis-trans isomerase [Phycisphaeraceae bacterium]|nr:FKBP-type peptidyl-prolyl cis-trans isomerase [Phycisphaeraceae bacterium]